MSGSTITASIAARSLTYQRRPQVERFTLDATQRSALKALSEKLTALKTQWISAPNPDLAALEPELVSILKLEAGAPLSLDRLLKPALEEAGGFTADEATKLTFLAWHFDATYRDVAQRARDSAARSSQRLQVGDSVITPNVHQLATVTAIRPNGDVDVTLERGIAVTFPAATVPFAARDGLLGIARDARVTVGKSGTGVVLGVYSNGIARVRDDSDQKVWTCPVENLTLVDGKGWAK
jgi:hypothetical protein